MAQEASSTLVDSLVLASPRTAKSSIAIRSYSLNQPSAMLMQKVQAVVAHFLVQPRQALSGLLAIGAPALLARQSLLGTAQLAHLGAIVTRVLDLLPIAAHQKAL